MTSIDVQTLYALLPAIYRLRDHEEGGPLRDLIEVIADQAAIVQEGIEQAYDDQFIETSAEWAVPYIGDLIGTRTLYAAAGTGLSARAVVANTLAYRRRKGTVAVLEQLARDVTNYPAVAVEFFQRLATTQHMNHPRPENIGTIDLRRPDLLERVDTAFDRAAHTLEVRAIPRGRYNIPNVGLFLFRLAAYPLVEATARRLDDRRFLFNPLGIDAPLFNQPETEALLTEFAGPLNVPMPISRLAMNLDKSAYYGADVSILVKIDGTAVPANDVVVCNLADLSDGSGDWAHRPADKVGIDPVLGRLALPSGAPAPAADAVQVTFRYGFSDAIGGGSYERAGELEAAPTLHLPAAGTVQDALDAAGGGAVIEVDDSRTYALAAGDPNLTVAAGARVEVRAANGQRPLVEMTPTTLGDGTTTRDFTIAAGAGARIVLSGVVLAGGALRITGAPAEVTLIDCTLVPGLARVRTNQPADPGAASLIVEAADVKVTLRRCIVGALRVDNGATVAITHSIVDATASTEIAYAAPPSPADAPGTLRPGGALTIENSTVIGRVATQLLELASNTIFVAAAPAGEAPVRAEQTQQGCVRFSYVPGTSRTPRRYRCQPGADAGVRPQFTSLLYGEPGYAQLRATCPAEIRRGADDEAEMGVFHDLYQPQREANLRIQLDEYMRFGLRAGLFYGS
ncbi:MAG: hypothetical protein KIT77_12205 [Caldilinea sp.]|nr:hypothetical protein [Caldilinea sp.]